MNKLIELRKYKQKVYGFPFVDVKKQENFFTFNKEDKIVLKYLRDGYFLTDVSGILLKKVYKSGHFFNLRNKSGNFVFKISCVSPTIFRIKKFL